MPLVKESDGIWVDHTIYAGEKKGALAVEQWGPDNPNQLTNSENTTPLPLDAGKGKEASAVEQSLQVFGSRLRYG